MTLDHVPLRRALLSVSDKTGLVPLAQALAERGVELLSTGGTAKALRDAGLSVVDLETFTGFPEMLDGRVKTLHPKVHGGLLGKRDDVSHRAQMEKHGITPIDLVVVNLYPFEKIAGQTDATWEALIENIDIGGPSMLRSAAKNHDAVCVVTDVNDYAELETQVKATGGTLHRFRRQCAIKALARTAAYDSAIADRLALKHEIETEGAHPSSTHGLGPVLSMPLQKQMPLRYGENPHQQGALYVARTTPATPSLSIADAAPLQGKELSYNNLLDADAAVFALRCLIDGAADVPAAVVIKHNTPCGAARAPTLIDAWKKARAGDPVSAFGGVVAVSHDVDAATADAMGELFLEVIIAPSFSAAALERLSQKTQLRLLAVPGLTSLPLPHFAVRSIAGGLLVQEHDRVIASLQKDATVVTKRAPTPTEWAALDVAWRMCASVKSNAITLANADMLLSAGGGQTSRVDSARIAVDKAREHKHALAGAACGSDAFFPFPDGLVVVADAGITAIVQPGGSKKDSEIIAAANERNIAMVTTGRRHFRH
jgi:phosphoribosylaminoimidazolecarboxamide formyltransferase / IMP cyclohydrolase